MAKNTKSPIKANPLRQAGESIRDEQFDLMFDKLLPLYAAVGFLWLLTAVEWIWWINGTKPNPLYLTAFAVLLTAYSIVRMIPPFRRLQNLKKGYKGERVVGEYLDRLRLNGYRIYHDIPGDSGNIDHVIISTRGVYTIETKTRSKPIRGQCKILYDGTAVSINGNPPDAAPIIQAKAQASQLKRLLKEKTGRQLSVRPIVVYPGWYTERVDAARQADVWVLSPKGLAKWIDQQPETISVEVVKHTASQLAGYVRNYKIDYGAQGTE